MFWDALWPLVSWAAILTHDFWGSYPSLDGTSSTVSYERLVRRSAREDGVLLPKVSAAARCSVHHTESRPVCCAQASRLARASRMIPFDAWSWVEKT